jgi:aspartyl-tRNA(Asn)/glutamyl-tRNA(Gln) amidotransferase subunit C
MDVNLHLFAGKPKCIGLRSTEINVAMEKKISPNAIDIEQVRHVARLARLELSAAEEESLQADLSAILAYVDKLNQLDTTSVEPTAQVGEAGTPMREDEVTNHPAAEEMLANAPARTGSFFRVPKIIE